MFLDVWIDLSPRLFRRHPLTVDWKLRAHGRWHNKMVELSRYAAIWWLSPVIMLVWALWFCWNM